MNLLSRLLVTGSLTVGFAAFGSASAHADWLACPGTYNTVAVCVAASPGSPYADATFTTVYEDCVMLTSPTECTVPVAVVAPVPAAGFDPAPSASTQTYCAGEPCAPAEIDPGPIDLQARETVEALPQGMVWSTQILVMCDRC